MLVRHCKDPEYILTDDDSMDINTIDINSISACEQKKEN